MVEYHVDACNMFSEQLKEKEFGSNLSVRFPREEKLLIISSHDECIFKQYALTKKAWAAPNGQHVLVLKDEGQGIMISAFQSQELGFGINLSQEQITEVNCTHHGEKYIDKKAAVNK